MNAIEASQWSLWSESCQCKACVSTGGWSLAWSKRISPFPANGHINSRIKRVFLISWIFACFFFFKKLWNIWTSAFLLVNPNCKNQCFLWWVFLVVLCLQVLNIIGEVHTLNNAQKLSAKETYQNKFPLNQA